MVQINELLPQSELEPYCGFESVGGDGLPEKTKYIIVERYCENPSCDCNQLVAEIAQRDRDDKFIAVSNRLALIKYNWSPEKKCDPVLEPV